LYEQLYLNKHKRLIRIEREKQQQTLVYALNTSGACISKTYNRKIVCKTDQTGGIILYKPKISCSSTCKSSDVSEMHATGDASISWSAANKMLNSLKVSTSLRPMK